MAAEYLVNLGIAQLYFDAEMKRCAPPGTEQGKATGAVHFVHISGDGSLMSKNWDIGLAEFTEAQRARAELYKKSDQ